VEEAGMSYFNIFAWLNGGKSQRSSIRLVGATEENTTELPLIHNVRSRNALASFIHRRPSREISKEYEYGCRGDVSDTFERTSESRIIIFLK
jgi:hypothetical protein